MTQTKSASVKIEWDDTDEICKSKNMWMRRDGIKKICKCKKL